MIHKPSIIISSIGRTGTTFFPVLLKEIIPTCTALHEPDIIHVNFKRRNISGDFYRFIEQVATVGFSKIIIQKLLGHFSISELSDTRVRSQKSTNEIKKELLRQRDFLVNRVPGVLYVESNFGYYGLLDIIPDVFSNVRIVYIIRDGRDWVRSWMNAGELYEKGKFRSLFVHTWLRADELDDDPYKEKWEEMSRFEKICWAWVRLNEFALTALDSNEHAKLIKFEDIFQSNRRYENLDNLLKFCLSINGLEKLPRKSTQGFLDRKINHIEFNYPGWDLWETRQKKQSPQP